jgi:hypothetical protein
MSNQTPGSSGQTLTSALKKRLNRTGITASPLDTKALLDEAKLAVPSSPGGPEALAAVRLDSMDVADVHGSMPPPTTVKGVAQGAIGAVKGTDATFLLDKLGERIAFERTGVRLYDALLAKHEGYGSFPGGPTRAELVLLRNQERQHFELVTTIMRELGGDPTAITPCGNVAAIEGMGLLAVLTDPRMSLAEGLHAMLIAELTDHDAWELLIDVFAAAGHDELTRRMQVALLQENEHLMLVRGWVEAHARHAAALRPEKEGAAE